VSADVGEMIARLLKGDAPLLIALVGSNGAGKTTFFETFLRHTGLPFVNADEIARSLGRQTDPYRAAKLAAALRADLIARRASFCMESVFSDPAGEKVELLRQAQHAGYRVLLIFVRIDSIELSFARVQQRVEVGGHDVPDEKLLARFERTRSNVKEALRFVDLAVVLDNNEVERPFRHVETWRQGVLLDA
jgi:predicted ABC-type ATPase